MLVKTHRLRVCATHRLLTALVTLALLPTACSLRGTPAPVAPTPTPAMPDRGPSVVPPAEQVLITFACSDYERSEYERLAELFHQNHPDITVQILSRRAIVGPEQEDAPVQARTALSKLASAADTFIFPQDIGPEDAHKGWIRDLRPFIEADPNFHPEDFYSSTLERFQREGGVWALPAKVYLTLIFFDKAVFNEAGLEYPHPGWSFDDFLTVATSSTEWEGGEVTRYGFINLWPRVALSFVLSHAGEWADESISPPMPTLDSPSMVAAMEWYVSLGEQRLMPNPAQTDSRVMRGLIRGAKAAMWVDLSERRLDYNRLFDLGIAPLPEGETIVDWVWTSGYMMSAGTTHPNESWRWLDFLTRQRLALAGEPLPARRSVAEASGYWDGLDEETAAIYQYILEQPHRSPPQKVVVDSLLEVLDTVLVGEKAVEEALAEAQRKARERTMSVEQTATTPQPVVVATPRPAKPEEGKITITFAPFEKFVPYLSLAKAFQEVHPEIEVEVVAAAEEGSEATISNYDCRRLFAGDETAEGLENILNLRPLLEADTEFPLDDFYSQFLEAFRWQGDLYGLPAAASLPLVYYNKDLFDAARIEYPRPGWDLNDFLEKALAVTKGEGKNKQYGFVPLLDFSDLHRFVRLHGATLVDTGAKPPVPRLNDPVTVEAMRWYADLALKHQVKPFSRFKDEYTDWFAVRQRYKALVTTGRAAMWVDHPADVYDDEPFPFQIGVAPLPSGKGWIAQEGYVTGYVISANTPHPSACWEWIKFLSAQLSIVKGLPARRSLAESPEYEGRLGTEMALALRYSLEQGIASFNNLDTVMLLRALDPVEYYWFNLAFDKVMQEEEAEQALSEAQRKAEEYMACLEKPSELEGRELYRACAREVDPTYGRPEG